MSQGKVTHNLSSAVKTTHPKSIQQNHKQKLLATNELKELFPEIKYQYGQIETILQHVIKIANSNSSALILGESGTGKELIAAAIHKLSARAKNFFVAINCSAIPEELLEAELFGYEKGAFTGAEKRRIGLFGKAHKSSLFLDEIGDMNPRLQAKILRVIQEKTYSPLGSNEIHEADIRFIAATNKDLEQAVLTKTFRLDLYYRLNVLSLKLPALRERKQDIPLLANYFIEQYNQANTPTKSYRLSQEVLTFMENYTWPGNVRQMRNIIERICTLNNGGLIEKKDLPEELTVAPATSSKNKDLNLEHVLGFLQLYLSNGINLPKLINTIENYAIEEALKRTQNNKSQAAKLLGINRTTLLEKIRKRKLFSTE